MSSHHPTLPLPLLLFCCLFLTPLASIQYGKTYTGDGTYYDNTQGGHCTMKSPLPKQYDGFVPVALNYRQYGNSLPCGACIEFTGYGQGSGGNPIVGTRKGYIMDECKTCHGDDIDLSRSGDGRWKVTWKFISCTGNKVYFQFQGSHQWYSKIQPLGTKTPVKELRLNGKLGERKVDNFFEVHAELRPPIQVDMLTVGGERITATLRYVVGDGMAYPDSQSSTRGPTGQSSTSSTASDRTPRNTCVPKWHTCKSSKKKCCDDFKCVRSRARGFNGWRCEPKKAGATREKCVANGHACSGHRNNTGTTKCCSDKFVCSYSKNKKLGYKICRRKNKASRGGGNKCVPNWKACTGRNNKWGTSQCCGKYKCVSPRQRSFAGKRCEPS